MIEPQKANKMSLNKESSPSLDSKCYTARKSKELRVLVVRKKGQKEEKVLVRQTV